jgi:hypothetical protein
MNVAGTVHEEFWFGGSDPARAGDFVAAWEYFKEVRESAYPEIPTGPESALDEEEFRELDQRSFAAELARKLGPRLHPHVEDLVRRYCWSSFGADSSEISAAAGLNFLASDLGGMVAFPGGNSAISAALVRTLRRRLGPQAIRSSRMVLDVRLAPGGVRVTYVDEDDRLRTVLAEACILATPKFVAARLVPDLPEPQLEAIRRLRYRAYLVANVLIDQPRSADFHDLYCILGKAPEDDPELELARRPFTDVVLATFAPHGHPDRTVLTLYRGLPFDGGRRRLLEPGSHESLRRLVEPALPATLAALGLDPARVRDLRLARWGHPLCLPSPGLISEGIPATAATPHQGRIFFAQQDNYALPAFEAGFSAAAEARTRVAELLG